jgi:hypothetical protein
MGTDLKSVPIHCPSLPNWQANCGTQYLVLIHHTGTARRKIAPQLGAGTFFL